MFAKNHCFSINVERLVVGFDVLALKDWFSEVALNCGIETLKLDRFLDALARGNFAEGNLN